MLRSSPAKSSAEPLLKKTKKPPHITSIPDDLLLSFFARISRLYYPSLSLSLVSKRFRSLLTSRELYKTRSLLGHTERFLYVCLQLSLDQNLRMFTLSRKPILTNDTTKKKKNKKSSGYVLATIPIPRSPNTHCKNVVSVGSSIYTIGGPINDSSSSNVWFLDFHCHTWHKAPSMLVERKYPSVNVFDGKIYVAGGCNSSNWMEVLNLKTGVWENVLSPERNDHVDKSAVIEGRIYHMFWSEGLVYKPREDKWETIGGTSNFNRGWSRFSYCVIDNVLYSASYSNKIQWYDFKRLYWMNMKGLKGLTKFARYGSVKLADYGGKLAVLWTTNFRYNEYKSTRISCAVIVLERRDSGEIWGNVESFDHVLTVPNSFGFVCALAATV